MFGTADGKTQVSTAEGGLFELSPNDQFAASPSLGQMMTGESRGNNRGKEKTEVIIDNKETNNLLKEIATQLQPGTMYQVP